MGNPSGIYNKVSSLIIEDQKKYEEKISLIRTTDDCDILQKEALKLISQGHDSSNFFKDRKDRMLGIAEKRYDLLC